MWRSSLDVSKVVRFPIYTVGMQIIVSLIKRVVSSQ